MTVFKSLTDRIFNFTQNQTTKEPNLVQASDGFSFKSFFKDIALKGSADTPFQNFNSKNLSGRVPFDQFEKSMHPPAPNRYYKPTATGFQDAVSFIADILEDLEDDEKDLYNRMRLEVHEVLQTAKEIFSDTGSVGILCDYLADNYTEYGIQQLLYYCDNYLDVINDVSLRDQVISFNEVLSTIRSGIRTYRFSLSSQQDIDFILQAETDISNLYLAVEGILVRYPEELDATVENINNLSDEYTPATKVDRTRTGLISYVKNYPLARYIKSDHLKAQANSVSPLAKSIDQPAQMDQTTEFGKVAATAAPDAAPAVAATSIGSGDKIQEENSSIDTTEYTDVVGPISKEEYFKWREWLAGRESSNNYSAVNSIGYCGRYQFGAPALIDLGYVRAGTATRALHLNSSWTGKDGISSRAQFLADTKLQDKLCLRYTRLNYKYMSNLKVVKNTDTPAHVGGLCAAAHLVGAGGAKAFINGAERSDANGTKASDYYKEGSAAIGGDLAPANASAAQANADAVGQNVVPDTIPMTIPTGGGAPVYPYNNTRTYESGHVEEFDNTPGAERINIKHRTGTGYEVDAKGNITYQSSAGRYEMVGGSSVVIINGIHNMYVEGDCGIVGNNVNVNAREDLSLVAGNDLNIKAAGLNINIEGDKTENIRGDSAATIGGFSNIGVDGDHALVAGSISETAREGNFNILGKNNVNILAGVDMNLAADGNLFADAKGDIQLSGETSLLHGESGTRVSSFGETSLASGEDRIRSNVPYESSLYADTAGLANLGTPVPQIPSGSAGGANRANTEKINENIDNFEASDFSSTQANSGGGDGVASSTASPFAATSANST